MPLRATINNVEIIAPFLTSREWENLKSEVKRNKYTIELPCCQQKGNFRTSKLGLQHFYHLPEDKECNWQPESPEHLQLKYEILKACKEAGWDAIPEYSENSWRADVLASKGNSRIAFEVQLSQISYAETKRRQEKYKQDNVRGCWFFKKMPFKTDYSSKEDHTLPIFILSFDSSNRNSIHLEPNEFKVNEFINHLLNFHVKACKKFNTILSRDLLISFADINCRWCKKPQHVFFVEDITKSKCGRPLDDHFSNWGSWGERLEYNPNVLNKVNQIVDSSNGELILGEVKLRYDGMSKSYKMSFGCKHCDLLLYSSKIKNLESQHQFDHEKRLTFQIQLELKKPFTLYSEHWCFSGENDFCE